MEGRRKGAIGFALGLVEEKEGSCWPTIKNAAA